MSDQHEFVQFKLISGDEIICELVGETEEEDEFIIRNPVQIVLTIHNSVRAYILKPWMAYQDIINGEMLLNKYHSAGRCVPHTDLMIQYGKALQILIDDYESRSGTDEENMDEIPLDMNSLPEEEKPSGNDSDTNILSFINRNDPSLH